MLLKSADHGYREITINKFSEGKDEDLQYPRLDQGVQDVQDTVVNRIIREWNLSTVPLTRAMFSKLFHRMSFKRRHFEKQIRGF